MIPTLRRLTSAWVLFTPRARGGKDLVVAAFVAVSVGADRCGRVNEPAP
jgi:hypothetical protein